MEMQKSQDAYREERRLRDKCYQLENQVANLSYEVKTVKSNAKSAQDLLRGDLERAESRRLAEVEAGRTLQEQTEKKLAEVHDAAGALAGLHQTLQSKLDTALRTFNEEFRRWLNSKQNLESKIETLTNQLGDSEMLAEDRHDEIRALTLEKASLLTRLAKTEGLYRQSETNAREWQTAYQKLESIATDREQQVRALRAQQSLEVRKARSALVRHLAPAFSLIRCASDATDLEEANGLYHAAAEQFFRLAPTEAIESDGNEMLSARAAAAFLHISKKRLRQISPLDLPYTRVGSGAKKAHRRYSREDLARYLAMK